MAFPSPKPVNGSMTMFEVHQALWDIAHEYKNVLLTHLKENYTDEEIKKYNKTIYPTIDIECQTDYLDVYIELDTPDNIDYEDEAVCIEADLYLPLILKIKAYDGRITIAQFYQKAAKRWRFSVQFFSSFEKPDENKDS